MKLLIKKGGAGSGHHGHRGRPGLHGGSLPGKSGGRDVVSIRPQSIVWSRKLNRAGKRVFGDTSFEEIEDTFLLPGATAYITWSAENNSTVRANIEWRDETGSIVGSAMRLYGSGRKGGKSICENETLRISADYQNRGFATSMYDRQIAQLRLSGFDSIQLSADISIGRYAWAKKGFDYVHDRAEMQSVMFRDWASRRGVNMDAWPTKPFASASAIASFDYPGISFTGSQIDNYDVPDDMVMHAGKAFMLDRDIHGHGSWAAVLKLQD